MSAAFGFSIDFVHTFLVGMMLIAPVILFLTVLVVGLGQVVGRIESWSRFNAFYWSLVTAMTVGYGDITPSKTSTKLLSLVIAFIGLILGGISVSIALEAAKISFEKNYDMSLVRQKVGVSTGADKLSPH